MTFSDLCSAVVLALATDYTGTGSDRSRDVPDARTVRYYTTLGLLDRPASFKGRTAYYGRKHLLQLVAIKRLQAKGLTLAQIQAQLVGMKPSQLEQLAQVPENVATPIEATSSKSAGPGRSREFWKQQPVQASTEPEPVTPSPVSLLGIPLTPEVTLLLPALRQLDSHDLEGLQVVAQPLLRWLQRRRILPDSTD
ncbi:MAG: helix-turn-helix domain-containing protein [Gemmatales bacterium]